MDFSSGVPKMSSSVSMNRFAVFLTRMLSMEPAYPCTARKEAVKQQSHETFDHEESPSLVHGGQPKNTINCLGCPYWWPLNTTNALYGVISTYCTGITEVRRRLFRSPEAHRMSFGSEGIPCGVKLCQIFSLQCGFSPRYLTNALSHSGLVQFVVACPDCWCRSARLVSRQHTQEVFNDSDTLTLDCVDPGARERGSQDLRFDLHRKTNSDRYLFSRIAMAQKKGSYTSDNM